VGAFGVSHPELGLLDDAAVKENVLRLLNGADPSVHVKSPPTQALDKDEFAGA
jgi:hypothetical protein